MGNRLCQDSTWDQEKLKVEFEFLSEFDLEIGLTAFDTPEIDLVLGGEEPVIYPEDLIEPVPPDHQPVSRLRDLWVLGSHRLICGDALESTTYQSLLSSEQVVLVFTDPPYNVAIDGHVKRKADPGTREFVMASGEMSPARFELVCTLPLLDTIQKAISSYPHQQVKGF